MAPGRPRHLRRLERRPPVLRARTTGLGAALHRARLRHPARAEAAGRPPRASLRPRLLARDLARRDRRPVPPPAQPPRLAADGDGRELRGDDTLQPLRLPLRKARARACRRELADDAARLNAAGSWLAPAPPRRLGV